MSLVYKFVVKIKSSRIPHRAHFEIFWIMPKARALVYDVRLFQIVCSNNGVTMAIPWLSCIELHMPGLRVTHFAKLSNDTGWIMSYMPLWSLISPNRWRLFQIIIVSLLRKRVKCIFSFNLLSFHDKYPVVVFSSVVASIRDNVALPYVNYPKGMHLYNLVHKYFAQFVNL